MQFIETRGNDGVRPERVGFSDAILHPAASFGGLYAPESLPDMSIDFLSEYLPSDYKTLAFALLKAFEIDIDEELLHAALERYERFDDPNDPAPVVQVEDDAYVCELYHGPTRAFKDMALQPFGKILSSLAQARGERYLIMAATSGDTGPATLETFKNEAPIKVACLYPAGGTSDVQRLQMVTEDAPNLKVIGIRGNFDDAQSALKELLASDTFREALDEIGLRLSAANSVNFGRIIFQIVYHVHAYLELVRKGEITLGEEIYIVIPSGNFGNALGAYYAKKAGLPIRKILIASNANNVLTEWIEEGRYDLRGRRLIQTESPAMDILKSSNVERVLFDKFGPERTRELMERLNTEGHYELTPEESRAIREDFAATYATDAEGEREIARYAEKGYLIDPHTATCFKAYRELRDEPLKTVIHSTAEWTKFSPTVARALGIEAEGDREALEAVSRRMGVPIPKVIAELFHKPVVHDTVVDKEAIMEEMLRFLRG
ncbi:threonine synthase [Nitratifractor sp.]